MSDMLLVATLKFILTHWGRKTHICVGKLSIIGSDNGLSPGRRQVIIWTNAGILLIWPLGTNFNDILIGIQTFSFKKMHLKMSSAKWRPFCLGHNVLTTEIYRHYTLTTTSSYKLEGYHTQNSLSNMHATDVQWLARLLALPCNTMPCFSRSVIYSLFLATKSLYIT